MKVLIAIDDTDNKQSRGTGYLARYLAGRLEQEGLATISGVTRHQLYVHEAIPYTSHNSAACICADVVEKKEIAYICRRIIRMDSAEGSDPGLCIAPVHLVDQAIKDWGCKAKQEVLIMQDAFALAEEKGIFLEGLGGTNGGVIGALAAVGLHTAGNDGRFLWVKGMRKNMGVMQVREILDETGVQELQCGNECIDAMNARVLLPEWWRPILRSNKRILIVEKSQSEHYEYQLISKDHLKRLSS